MELFHIGTFSVRLYSVMLLVGIIAGALLARHEAKRRGESPDKVLDAVVYCVPLALIGARAYHVVSEWDYYQDNLLYIFAFWRGGLGIFGVVAGAMLGMAAFTVDHKIRALWSIALSKIRRRDVDSETKRRLSLPRLPISRWLDIGAPSMLLGQVIGRWGNFFNQELYGPPTDLPWGIHIDPENRLEPYKAYDTFHPIFFYEGIWNLIGMFTLLYLARRFRAHLKDGDIALAYCIWYPLGRFMLENFRWGNWSILGLPTAQWVGLTAMVVSGALLLRRHPPRPSRAALVWLIYLAGLVTLVVVGMAIVSLTVMAILVPATALYVLAGLIVVARVTLPAQPASEKAPRRRRAPLKAAAGTSGKRSRSRR